MFEDGSYLTNKIVDYTLKYLLKDVDGMFTSHSLRIGAATIAAANNVLPEEIQKASRWKSNNVCHVCPDHPYNHRAEAVRKGLIYFGAVLLCKIVAGSWARQLLGCLHSRTLAVPDFAHSRLYCTH